MKKSSAKITVVFILIITLVVGYYAYLSNRRQVSRKEAEMSAAENVLTRDLTMDYPPTPKEVVKYYNEILRCFYNEDCTDEEIERLGNRARELYDAELLENNEPDTYMIRLKGDIQTYKENNRRISNISVASSINVDTYTVDNYDFARLSCSYFILEGSSSKRTNMVYLLRRDENKRWKIYGWDLAENVETAEKTEE